MDSTRFRRLAFATILSAHLAYAEEAQGTCENGVGRVLEGAGTLAKQNFLFVFPKMPGDVNPSFAIARKLVAEGHRVSYLSPDYQEAIEGTGATFLDAKEYYDLYNGKNAHKYSVLYAPSKHGVRSPETFGAANQLKKEFNIPQGDGEYMVRTKIANVELVQKLGGVMKAIDDHKIDTIVYDPVLCREAAIAAQFRELPVVALLAFNGHGAWNDLVHSKMINDLPDSKEDYGSRIDKFQLGARFPANIAATDMINKDYANEPGFEPLYPVFTEGRLDPIPDICLVTSTVTEAGQQSKDLIGSSKVHYLGALLDEAGSLRAGGPTNKDQWKKVEAKMNSGTDTGHTIFVSMGTVTTADGDLGWTGSPNSALTGEVLCQSVWGAAIDALGKDSGNVILMTVGKDSDGNPRPLANGDSAPANALLAPSMPQVDILKKGIDLFVTHGGQNSFVESITLGVPMLVVPTVGDQIDNAAKAAKTGIGDTVPRPLPSTSAVTDVATAYREAVKEKILEMLASKTYKEQVVKASSQYVGGGVEAGVKVLLNAYEQAPGGKPFMVQPNVHNLHAVSTPVAVGAQ